MQAAEDFLGKLRPMCDKKAKEFEARNMLRVNEEASIAEAVNILTSDEAFKAFLETDSSESFLQLRSEKRLAAGQIRMQVQRVLENAALNDARLVSIVALIEGNNPFTVIFHEIDKMVDVMEKEQRADEDKHSFCTKQTDSGKKKLKDTQDNLDKIEDAIEKL